MSLPQNARLHFVGAVPVAAVLRAVPGVLGFGFKVIRLNIRIRGFRFLPDRIHCVYHQLLGLNFVRPKTPQKPKRNLRAAVTSSITDRTEATISRSVTVYSRCFARLPTDRAKRLHGTQAFLPVNIGTTES